MITDSISVPREDRLSAIRTSKLFWPLAALALLLSFNLITDPSFFAIEYKNGVFFGSLIDILNRAAPVALLALGMTLVIATGGIDLSVGSIMAIAGATSAWLISHEVVNSLWLILAISLGVSLLAGLWNGLLVTALGIQPIIATLILMVAGRGIAQLITNGQVLTFSHEGFEMIGGGAFLGLPLSISIVICSYALALLLLRKTALGLFIESIGSNPIASHYTGIRSNLVKFSVYGVCGVAAGLAGLILTSDIQGADANNVGLWSELDAILAVVIGGTALTGGRFSLSTTLVGVVILQTLTTTILTHGLPVQYTLIVKSAVVIIVMLLMSAEFRHQMKSLFQRGQRSE
ncbi:sugar ABC transporter permease [Endozoicomonas sp. OPT23]|uniref:ABC transporter permease n=1 Tax=Endozoicomonas sp. OPT23 TaxID=2072845 RepID=UPI00129BBCCF|nr:ABC transporter permease [Endozoicomonas sp. OPT23]MRI31668.1 sugar ABC transporter permease [Endozoicomonas sp. OPT23]